MLTVSIYLLLIYKRIRGELMVGIGIDRLELRHAGGETGWR
jgi:hypothetical protein